MRLLPVLVLGMLAAGGLTACGAGGAESTGATKVDSSTPADPDYTQQDCQRMLGDSTLGAFGWSGTPTTSSGGFGCTVTTGRGTVSVLRTVVPGANRSEVAGAAPKVLSRRCTEVGARTTPPMTLSSVDWVGRGRPACADTTPSTVVVLTPSSKVVQVELRPTVTLGSGEAQKVLAPVAGAAQ